MPEIIKTEALVLRKIDFGDTSKISSFYTKEFGKISAIVKGARTAKSKIGKIVDILNHVEIILYKKDSREVQLIKDISLISYFPEIKADLERLTYSSAIIELLDKFTLENETNYRLFRGTVKMLNLINSNNTDTALLFVKYFHFFLSEIGYEINISKCHSCYKELSNFKSAGFNYEFGFICPECKNDYLISFEFSEELFKFFYCLTTKQKINSLYSNEIKKLIIFFEKFLKYFFPEFSELRSLKMFNT